MDNVNVMNSIDDLLKNIKNIKDIIIYGCGEMGKNLLDFLMNNYYSIRPSSYSGNVRYFATNHDMSEPWRGLKEIKGIPIRTIYDLKQYAKTVLVVVASEEEEQEISINILQAQGFDKIAIVSKELYAFLKKENQQVSGGLRLEVMNYGLCHQNKLNIIREKVKQGKKVNVLFMTQRWSMFGCKSIYRIMEKSSVFAPQILVFSKRDRLYENWQDEVKEDVLHFQENGYNVVSAYDELGYLVDLDTYKPDILFFDGPNLHATAGMSYLRNDILNWKYLTCYVPYGCLMAESFYYHFENINIREAWIYFIDSRCSYRRNYSEASFNANNMVLSGYPKLDDYFEEKSRLDVPEKICNGNKIVIYAPHWTINCNNKFSTFHKYYDYFIRLARENPNINFVFKPHPQLGHRIQLMEDAQVQGMITYGEYVKYIEEWDSLPNGIYINGGDYIDLFRASDCMITDCGSFIGEYLFSGKPCIYLLNTDKESPLDGYTENAKGILDTYYLCKNLEEIKETVDKVVFQEQDLKFEERENIMKMEFANIGHVGEFIVDYLEKKCLGE